MKALMIITLVSGLNTQPAEFATMDKCLEAAPKVQAQTTIADVACIPFTPEQSVESKFESMFSMFLTLIQQIQEQEEAQKENFWMEQENEYSKCKSAFDATCMHRPLNGDR